MGFQPGLLSQRLGLAPLRVACVAGPQLFGLEAQGCAKFSGRWPRRRAGFSDQGLTISDQPVAPGNPAQFPDQKFCQKSHRDLGGN